MVPHLLRKSRYRLAEPAHLLDGLYAALEEPVAGFGDEVAHHAIDQPANRFMDQARLIEPGIARADLLEHRADERHLGEIGDGEEAGAQPVVDVMVVVGDVVGERGDLRFWPGIGVEPQSVLPVIFGDRGRHRPLDAGPAQRTVVLDGAFERLPRQIEPVELGIGAFEAGQDAQRLVVVREAAKGLHLGIERVFAGMAERGVAEVMREANRLGEVLVEAERARGCAGDLGDFEAVGQPRAEMVALVIDEDLGLVLQPAKRRRMDDAIAVALKRRTHLMLRLRVEPAAAFFGI